MRLAWVPVLAICVVAAAGLPRFGSAQDQMHPAVQTTVTASALSPAQYDELVAPVALYPDALLADVLAASTYPLEVVEADRWLQDSANSSLAGDELVAAADTKNWDPSVTSLVPFPDVLAMLDSHLTWTENLGQAFLADPDAVLAAVQRMRARAMAAGNLSSNAEQTVSDTDNDIAISPPPSNDLYVPQYDPWCAFGNWPYSVPPPYYFEAWPGYCEPAQYAVLFASGIAWPSAWWGWGYFDWRHRKLLVRRDYYEHFHPAHAHVGNLWQHDATRDVRFSARNLENRRAFVPPPPARPQGRGLVRATRSKRLFRPPPHVAQMPAQQRLIRPRPVARPFTRGFAPAARPNPRALSKAVRL